MEQTFDTLLEWEPITEDLLLRLASISKRPDNAPPARALQELQVEGLDHKMDTITPKTLQQSIDLILTKTPRSGFDTVLTWDWSPRNRSEQPRYIDIYLGYVPVAQPAKSKHVPFWK